MMDYESDESGEDAEPIACDSGQSVIPVL